jgi:hypothetical protein
LVISSAALLLYIAENINGFPNYKTPVVDAEIIAHEGDFRTEFDTAANMFVLRPEPLKSPISGNMDNLRNWVWILTIPIMALVIIPIEVLESSRLRVLLRAKRVIVSPANPYKVLLGIAAGAGPITAVEVIQRETSGLVMEFAFPAIIMILPLIPMIFLYKRSLEDRAVWEFLSYLKNQLRIRSILNPREIPE